jgi:hypothetical protein
VPLCAPSGAGRAPAGPEGACRPNTARRDLLAFYQGAHSFNGARDVILSELHKEVFSQAAPAAGGVTPQPQPQRSCDCAQVPSCCVNATSGVAYFHSKSHWHPVMPLGFAATTSWMQRSRFCICPPGDVPYNKRYFQAVLAGCVPAVFSFTSQVRNERNWWKPRKGPGQADIDPFHRQINHSELAIEIVINGDADYKGFVQQLRRVPDDVVEAKQRAIERARHQLLYDVSGSQPDAFSAMLRQLLRMLTHLPVDSGGDAERVLLRRPDRGPTFGLWHTHSHGRGGQRAGRPDGGGDAPAPAGRRRAGQS